MALSDNKRRNVIKHPEYLTEMVDVAPGKIIYDGAILSQNASGYAEPAPATGAFFFMGIANGFFDNSIARTENGFNPANPTTGRPLTIDHRQVEQLVMDVAPALTDIGKAIFYIGDDTVSLTKVAITGVAGSQVGILNQIITPSGTDVFIDTSKAVTA